MCVCTMYVQCVHACVFVGVCAYKQVHTQHLLFAHYITTDVFACCWYNQNHKEHSALHTQLVATVWLSFFVSLFLPTPLSSLLQLSLSITNFNLHYLFSSTFVLSVSSSAGFGAGTGLPQAGRSQHFLWGGHWRHSPVAAAAEGSGQTTQGLHSAV